MQKFNNVLIKNYHYYLINNKLINYNDARLLSGDTQLVMLGLNKKGSPNGLIERPFGRYGFHASNLKPINNNKDKVFAVAEYENLPKLSYGEKQIVEDTFRRVKSGSDFLYICRAALSNDYSVGACTQQYFDDLQADFQRTGNADFNIEKCTPEKLGLLMAKEMLLNEPSRKLSIKTRARYYQNNYY